MIRDRGKIKWTSMMLPEHVKMLRDWAEEDSFEKRRELDEQELEMMNEV
ncbi:YolD-like family protein, partial [Rossellomorea marisflavi]